MSAVRVIIAAGRDADADDLVREAENAGYRVAGRAASGKEAAALAGSRHAALVLMDMHLPGRMSVPAAVQQIQDGCGIPVVSVAADDAELPPQRRGAAVPYGCLVRPFGPREFRQVTGAAIEIFSRVRAGHDPAVNKVAHDINNMLSSALANIQLSRRTCPRHEQVLGHLDSAEKSVLRARDHSRQLLASVEKTGQAPAAPCKVNGKKPAKTVQKKRTAERYRILLMDDEEAILSATSEMLTFLGHEVSVAENGDAAVGLYRKAQDAGSPFDAVILDITVPGGKGAGETLPLLKTINPEIRAVVSSGYATHPLVVGFAASGFVAALVKPYGFKELEESLALVFRE